MNSNFLNEGLKTITLSQLIIKEATYNRKWPVEMGHSEMVCSISTLSSANNKEILDMQNPQPEQPWEQGEVGEGKGDRGRGSLWQRKAAALTISAKCHQARENRD